VEMRVIGVFDGAGAYSVVEPFVHEGGEHVLVRAERGFRKSYKRSLGDADLVIGVLGKPGLQVHTWEPDEVRELLGAVSTS